MTTPNDVQNEINAVPWTNGKGLVTGATISALLTAIVGLFVYYAPLASPTFTGTVTIPNLTVTGTATGNVSSATSTATRGTSALTNATRADVHLSVEDFGAVGDCGTTDNTTAINNALAALRAQSGYAGGGELDFGTDKCYLAGSLNMTALYSSIIDFHGSKLLSSAMGNVSAIDAVQSTSLTIRNLNLTNYNANLPLNAIQMGRALNGLSGAASMRLENVNIDGYFGQSILYDRAVESSSFDNVFFNNRNNSATSYGAIFDGEAAFQIYSNFASTYNPSNPSVADALYGTSPGMSFNETLILGGNIGSYYAPAIWSGGTRALMFVDSYLYGYFAYSSAGPCFILNTTGAYTTSELSIRAHCEGDISSVVQFTGSSTQSINGLDYINHFENVNSNGTEFSLGSGVTSVTIHDLNYHVYNVLNSGVSAFDTPSAYTLDGMAYGILGLFNGTINGLNSSNGTENYTGSIASTASLPGLLNVNKITNTNPVTSISVTLGASTYFQGSATVPTLAIAPPPAGGSQATAVIATAGYFGGSLGFSGTMSGYAVNDVVTFSDGNCGTPISFKVAAVTGGVPTALGSNSVVGSCPASESTLTAISTTDSGSGTGLKVNGQSFIWRALTATVTNGGGGYSGAPAITQSTGSIQATATLGSGTVDFGAPQIIAGPYSAAGTAVPTCNAAAQGEYVYATDITTYTFNTTYVSGGSNKGLLLCNGTNWTAH